MPAAAIQPKPPVLRLSLPPPAPVTHLATLPPPPLLLQVMPWVVADYSSPTLDLSDPATYRDLSKPIGALIPRRLHEFQQRYAELKQMAAPGGGGGRQPLGAPPPLDMPPFLYGCHYSSPGYVVFYLMRSDPQLMLRLQVGVVCDTRVCACGVGWWWGGGAVGSGGQGSRALLAEHAQPALADACTTLPAHTNPPAERPLRRPRPPLLVHRRHLEERAVSAVRREGAGAGVLLQRRILPGGWVGV